LTAFVVPAAGLGLRFRDLFPGLAKPLIPINGRPMLDLVVDNLEATAADILIVVGRTQTGLSNWKPSRFPGEYIYHELESLTPGPASTVAAAVSQIPKDSDVIVLNSDQVVREGIGPFRDALSRVGYGGLVMTMTATGDRWSFVETRAGVVKRLVEKEEISSEATVGVYGWTHRSILELSLSLGTSDDYAVKGELYVGPTFNPLIAAGIPVLTHYVGAMEQAVAGLGTPSDLETSLGLGWFQDYLSSKDRR